MIDQDKQFTRWLTYIDILGFTELIKNNHWINVYTSYAMAIEEFTREDRIEPDIEKIWFSDTFLIYAPDDTKQAFLSIQQTTMLFMHRLILAGIPFRGAMSCKEFYADKENNLFFGKALNEAYDYGEKQDWIGFILAPSAVEQVKQVGLSIKSLGYEYWDIPQKKTRDTKRHLPAYVLGGHGEVNGQNLWLEKLIDMHSRLVIDEYKIKYKNTINFTKTYWEPRIKR